MSEVWSAIGAISAAFGTLIVLAASIYAYMQVREARLARTVNLLWAFHDRYHSDPLRTVRHQLLRGELGDLHQLDHDDIRLLTSLIDQLQFLGILVDRKLLDFQLVKTTFSNSPPRVWKAAKEYIDAQREHSPQYGAYFEKLIRRY